MADTLRLLLGLCLVLGGWAVEAYTEDDQIEIRPGLPRKCFYEPKMEHSCGGGVFFRWYYSKYSDSCKVFLYRGCHDNGNNFASRKECINQCIKSSGLPPPPPPPNQWERPDGLESMYGEPNAKHLRDGNIPFVNNLDTEEAPPRDHHQRPMTNHRNQQSMMSHRPYTSPMFRRPMSGPPQLPSNRHPYQEPHPQPQQQQQQPKQEAKAVEGKSGLKIKPTEFMSDSDIFDSSPNPEKKEEKQAEEESEKTTVSELKAKKSKSKPEPSDFMSDSDIFDGLPTIPKDSDKQEEKEKKDQEIEEEDNDATKGADKEYDFTEGDLDDGGLYTDPETTPRCLQFPETGSCRAYIRRWFFDPRKGDCFTFIYGGCDGNRNSFATKEECVNTCAVPDTGRPEERKGEMNTEEKPDQMPRNYFGLRRNKPAPEFEPAETFQPEPHEDIDEFDREQEQESSSDESSSEQVEARQGQSEGDFHQDNRVPVINHFYTYHNYGPYHSKHRTFNSAAYRSSSERESESSESSSEEEQQEEEQQKERPEESIHRFTDQNPEDAHDNHVSNLISSPFPSPLKFFFKILKKIRPRNSLAIMRPRSENKPIIQSYHRKTNDGGVSFVRFLFSKKPRNMPEQFSPMQRPQKPRFNMRPFPESRQAPRQRYNPPAQRPQKSYPDLTPFDLQPHGPSMGSNPHEQLMIERFLKSPPKKASYSTFPLMPFVLARQHNVHPAAMSPVKAQHGEPNVACMQERDEGQCPPRIGMPRWYYDKERGICDIFFYNGCGGTLNRFDTFEQCRDVCMVRSPAPPVDMEPKAPKPETPVQVTKEEVKQELKAEEKEEEEKEKVVVEEKTKEEDSELNQPSAVRGYDFASMHMDSRMEFILVIIIMILGGTALIVLVAITAFYMYKKHKLASRFAKETTIEKMIQAHAYPEIPKISVIELPGNQVAGVHAIKQI